MDDGFNEGGGGGASGRRASPTMLRVRSSVGSLIQEGVLVHLLKNRLVLTTLDFQGRHISAIARPHILNGWMPFTPLITT